MHYSINSRELDNHITGHYGEDQFGSCCDNCELDCEPDIPSIPANCPLITNVAEETSRNEESLYELKE